MRLKALLVDDEIHILNNLSKVLPWEGMDIEIVGLAKNGVDALEIVAKHHPDLILSDIRMPVMDGITLLQKIREQGFPCEILLLTGYQEFEYARTGIKYGVKDYICKPINYAELEETVRGIARQIRENRKKQNKEQRLNQVVFLANENYILHSLLGQKTAQERALWDEEGGLAAPKDYSLLLLDLEGYSYRSITWTVHERKAWNLHMKNRIKETFGKIVEEPTVLQVREGEWCVVFSPLPEGHSITKEQVQPGFIQIQQIVNDKENMQLRLCIDQRSHPLHEMSAVYQRMQQMLILNPVQEWYLDMETEMTEPAKPEMNAADKQWRWVEQLGNGLRNGSQEAIGKIVTELKSYIGHLSGNEVGGAEKLLHYVLIHLLREMREMQMLSLAKEEEIWYSLQGSLSLKELLFLIVSLLEQSQAVFSAKKTSELLMISAQNYIQHHMEHDFGIEDISDYLGISCSYFCLLFKNYFGETFVEYLTKQRMEMAKCLLRSSDKSIAQIGSGVGYQERRYFTKVFQKYTGMTPSEFRMKESTVS